MTHQVARPIAFFARLLSLLGLLAPWLIMPGTAKAHASAAMDVRPLRQDIWICEIIFCPPPPDPCAIAPYPCIPVPEMMLNVLQQDLPVYDRGESLPISFSQLSPAAAATLTLYRYDPLTGQVQPSPSTPQVATSTSGEYNDDLGALPSYMPSGQYLLVGCSLADCSLDAIAAQLTEPASERQGVDFIAFTVPPRFDQVTAEVAMGGEAARTFYLNTQWDDPLASPQDRIRIKWYFNDKPFVEYENSAISDNVPLLNFLEPDRQGTDLYAPTLYNRLAPGINYLYPDLAYPSLDEGRYRVEVHLNSALEMSQTITVTLPITQ